MGKNQKKLTSIDLKVLGGENNSENKEERKVEPNETGKAEFNG